MTDERYRVVFKGQLADKATLDEVTTNLTALYKNNSAKVDAILSSSNAVIKKDLDLVTCKKIQKAFQKAGAICSIEKQAADSYGLDNLTMESADISGRHEPLSPSENSPNSPTPPPLSRPPDLQQQREKRQTVHTSNALPMAAQKPPGIKRPDEKYCQHCGQLNKRDAKTCSRCGGRVGKKLSKAVLLLITFFTGGIGGHKFYVGKPIQGILYLVFFWTFIPGFIAFIEFFIYAVTNENDLQDKYPEAGGKEVVIVLLIVGFIWIIAFIGILAAIAIPNFISYRNKAYFAQIENELNQLAAQQELYYGTHARYAQSIDELGISPGNDKIALEIITTEKDCFIAKGTYVGTTRSATIDCNGAINREGFVGARQAEEATFIAENPFTSDEGYFSISFPGEPTESSQEISTELGPITIFFYTYDYRNGAYLVSYLDYPDEIIEQSDSNDLLNAAQSGAVVNVNGQLISSKDIYIETYPGKEIVFKIPKSKRMPPGGIGKARFYLVDNRLYQILSVQGGMGFAAGGNINPEKKYPSMFEPIHGSAPKYEGKGIVNPMATIESIRMMLSHLGETEASRDVEVAISEILAAGIVKTRDMGGNQSTSEMGDAVRNVILGI